MEYHYTLRIQRDDDLPATLGTAVRDYYLSRDSLKQMAYTNLMAKVPEAEREKMCKEFDTVEAVCVDGDGTPMPEHSEEFTVGEALIHGIAVSLTKHLTLLNEEDLRRFTARAGAAGKLPLWDTDAASLAKWLVWERIMSPDF